ncbi:MAG: acyl carrier protein [Acidobacteria bacterium]|nr:MAG: acyl carrier protein [Acidobacteriota bacterium]REK03687.1 MAG: acyl carrier protein [Acidobacteriota bacterium]
MSGPALVATGWAATRGVLLQAMAPPSEPASAPGGAREQVLDRIRSELAAMQLEVPETLRLDTRLADDLSLTSLDAVDLVLALEDAFEIELEDDDVASFETVADVVDAVLRQQAAAAGDGGEPAPGDAENRSPDSGAESSAPGSG